MKIEIEVSAAQMARFRRTAKRLSIPTSEIPWLIEKWADSRLLATEAEFWTRAYYYPSRKAAASVASRLLKAHGHRSQFMRYVGNDPQGRLSEVTEEFANRAVG